MSTFSVSAPWVFPVSSPPIENARVVIQDGKILAVEKGKGDEHLPDAAIIPGLVNAHTHLDLTGLRGQTPPSKDYISWLKKIIQARRVVTPEMTDAAIRDGIKESIAAGVTALGDISGTGASYRLLESQPLRSIVFREVIGMSDERAKASMEAWKGWSHALITNEVYDQDKIRFGISPHAPYSASKNLIAEAAEQETPFCMHYGEFAEERMLQDSHSGPFADLLKKMGLFVPGNIPRLSNDLFKLRQERGQKGNYRPVIYAHGNYVSPGELFGAESIAYCPRTHAAFGHSRHPVLEYLTAYPWRVVCLGTDSVASNPDLDLFAELVFLRSHRPDIPPETLLEMATINGAWALDIGYYAGCLEENKSADLCVIPLDGRPQADPHDLLFKSERALDLPRKSMFEGVWRKT